VFEVKTKNISLEVDTTGSGNWNPEKAAMGMPVSELPSTT